MAFLIKKTQCRMAKNAILTIKTFARKQITVVLCLNSEVRFTSVNLVRVTVNQPFDMTFGNGFHLCKLQ